MARKPASIQLAGGKGPRQRVWDLIRAHHQLGGHFELLQIVPGDINTDTAETYLRSLVAAGIVELVGVRPGARTIGGIKRYRLAQDKGIEAPRVNKAGKPVTQGLAQEQMWRTLRTLKADINGRELAAYAGTPAVPVAATAAIHYLRDLNAAGYLDMTADSKHLGGRGKTPQRFRLRPDRNTGPRAPMVCRTSVVYDPNTDQTHAAVRVSEETAIYGD